MLLVAAGSLFQISWSQAVSGSWVYASDKLEPGETDVQSRVAGGELPVFFLTAFVSGVWGKRREAPSSKSSVQIAPFWSLLEIKLSREEWLAPRHLGTVFLSWR